MRIRRRGLLRAGAASVALGGWAQAVPAADLAIRIQVGQPVRGRDSVPRLFGTGGNIWATPAAFPLGVSDRVLALRPLGITRVSLGSQLFELATSRDDLERRLAALPVNDFLRRFKADGGRVLLSLNGTPRWLATNPSTEVVKGPDEPAFNLSPPSDWLQWSAIVELVVRHFNGKLGLAAFYEVRNEPNYYYRGTNAQFFQQYYYTALGARRADPRALVGGPGISEFLGVTTAGESARTEADKLRIIQQTLEHRYLFRQFIDQAASTPLKELGLPRLPLDFFSWHAFYFDPTRYYAAVVPYVRSALAEAGYPADLPMINSEWNLAAVPPYPEGDLNASEVGAAYAAVSLIAMDEAGVDGQSFQMYVDSGTDGYYGGYFDNRGYPRATFHALSLFTRLRGKRRAVTSSDPWVKAVAFGDDDELYLLVASLVPTREMLKNTLPVLQNLRHRDFAKTLVREGQVESLVKGRSLTPELARRAREIEAEGEQSLQQQQRLAESRQRRLSIDIDIAGLRAPRQVSRFIVDATHANVWPMQKRAVDALKAQNAQAPVPQMIQERLKDTGVSGGAADAVVGDLRAGKGLDEALVKLPGEQRERARSAVEGGVRRASEQIRKVLAEIEAWPGAGLREEPVEWPASGPLRVEIEPYSVLLYVIRR